MRFDSHRNILFQRIERFLKYHIEFKMKILTPRWIRTITFLMEIFTYFSLIEEINIFLQSQFFFTMSKTTILSKFAFTINGKIFTYFCFEFLSFWSENFSLLFFNFRFLFLFSFLFLLSFRFDQFKWITLFRKKQRRIGFIIFECIFHFILTLKLFEHVSIFDSVF